MKYILGAYSQIPFGSDDSLVETVLNKTLKPLLTNLYSDSKKKLILFLSINEFEYLELKHPEINMLIYDLCKKNQIELLAGAYYDSMLPMIPTHERTIQIEKSINYIRKRFGKKPKGMWCLNQYFSPSLVSILQMCGLDYLVISSYSQTTNSIITSKPSYMNEMGKKILIIPFDDKFSKEISDFRITKNSEEKLLNSIQKLCSIVKDTVTCVMFSLEQLCSLSNPSSVFETVFSNLAGENIIPSLYFQTNKISRNTYLPWGIFGRDLDLGKKTSVNQNIIENPLLNRYYQSFTFFRDYSKTLKKNSLQRNKIENCFQKSNSTSLYVNDNYKYADLRIYANKCLSEIENTLLEDDILPSQIDISGDGLYHFVSSLKNSIVYINPKGATISRFSIPNCSWDLMNHNGDSMFEDSFINLMNSKKVSLANRIFEISSLDKRRMDFFATTGFIDLGNNILNLIKRFKFRQNTTILEIEFENNGNSSLDKFCYENKLNIFLNENCPLIESEELSELTIEDKNLPFKFELSFSEKVLVESKHVFNNLNNYLGDKKIHQYTQINIKKKLSLKPNQEEHLSLAMKIEKRKEKK